MTRTPLSRSIGQRSRSPGCFTNRGVYTSGSCSGERGNVFSVENYCYLAVRRRRIGGARRFDAHRGRRGAGAYCVGRPPTACYYYPLKRCFCLTSFCLSVAFIGPKSRTERPRKTKIGTEITHVTIFKVKVSRPLYSARP